MSTPFDIGKALRDAGETAELRRHLQERMNSTPASRRPQAQDQVMKLSGERRSLLSWFRKPVSPFAVDRQQIRGWLDTIVQAHPPRLTRPPATPDPSGDDPLAARERPHLPGTD